MEAHTERCLDISANNLVASVLVTRLLSLAQAGDPALSETDTDVDLSTAQGCDHMASARGKGDELGIQAIVLLCEVDRSREVLGHKANAEWLG